MPKNALDTLLETTPILWKGRQPNHVQSTLPTGHAALDRRLPGGGWPLGAVSELITARPGLGELSLLLPALAEMTRQGRWIVLVNPPWVPYPAFLHAHGLSLDRLLMVRANDPAEALWVCEQALCNGRDGAVLAWPDRVSFSRMRRLQLAARENAATAFLYRPESVLEESSPSALRLRLEPGGRHGTRISILKCRGSHPPPPTWIRLSGFANDVGHAAGHETSLHQPHRTLLAGRAPAPPRPGPAYPRPGREEHGDGRQLGRQRARTDH